MKRAFPNFYILGFILIFLAAATAQASDPLPSWNAEKSKQAIIQFVEDVTKEGGPHYVPPEARIATFDNDGTLRVEYPMYTQVLFAFEQVKELAPQHPEWKTKQPFKTLLEGDMQMVKYTKAGEGRRLGLFVHRTDAEPEFAYDHKTTSASRTRPSTRRLPTVWVIVDMKKDWKVVFPDFEKAKRPRT